MSRVLQLKEIIPVLLQYNVCLEKDSDQLIVTLYTYLFLYTQSADPNLFRGTILCSWNKWQFTAWPRDFFQSPGDYTPPSRDLTPNPMTFHPSHYNYTLLILKYRKLFQKTVFRSSKSRHCAIMIYRVKTRFKKRHVILHSV